MLFEIRGDESVVLLQRLHFLPCIIRLSFFKNTDPVAALLRTSCAMTCFVIHCKAKEKITPKDIFQNSIQPVSNEGSGLIVGIGSRLVFILSDCPKRSLFYGGHLVRKPLHLGGCL